MTQPNGCADVCVFHDYEATNEFYTERTVTARKAHTCVECERPIKPGDSYLYSRGKDDNGFFDAHTCRVCDEVRKAFVCGGAVFGFLWESIAEELFPRWRREGPFECMAKLQTPEAREYCHARFVEWGAA